jgi:hypothetical protein
LDGLLVVVLMLPLVIFKLLVEGAVAVIFLVVALEQVVH